jgi:hypothetical protein
MIHLPSNSHWPDTAIRLLRPIARAIPDLPARPIAKTTRHRLIERHDRNPRLELMLDTGRAYRTQLPKRRSNPHSTRAHHTLQHRLRGFLP